MKNILSSKFLTVGLAALIFWLGVSLVEVRDKKSVIENKVATLEAKSEDIKKSSDYLEKFITYLSNPSFLDKEARIKLNYKTAGEEVVYVYHDRATATPASASAETNKKEKPFYKKIWNFIFDI